MEEISSSPREVHRMATFISFQPEPTTKSTMRIVHPHPQQMYQQQPYQRTMYPIRNSSRSSNGKRRSSSSQQQESQQLSMNMNVEPYLVTLCRQKKWVEVLQRCYSHPEETIPRKVVQNKRMVSGHMFPFNTKTNTSSTTEEEEEEDEPEPIYYETSLGIACVSIDIQTPLLQDVIHTLIRTNPKQLNASQLLAGHTPLRDAVRNPRLSPELLRSLLVLGGCTSKAAGGGSWTLDDRNDSIIQSALQKTDRNGMLPLDHLIMSVQLGSHPQAVDLLKELTTNSNGTIPSQQQQQSATAAGNKHTATTSPLIRLLSLGTSFGSKGVDSFELPLPRMMMVGKSNDTRAARLDNIVEATKHMLDTNPSLIRWNSRITGCSPLHVALRNYGDYEPLIREIVSRDESGTTMSQRNQFGDLPLHVACSVGVPMAVLRLILEHTLAGSEDFEHQGCCFSPHQYLWSTNNSGYTPIDLEWVRHIESGKSFYSARSFYPLEPTGVTRHCFKQDEYYQALLRDAVDQVVQEKPSSHPNPLSRLNNKKTGNTLAAREDEAKRTFGVLIDRIKLLVSASAMKTIPADPNASLLHNASKLCSPAGPNLPLPLLELISWMHSDQIHQADPCGNLPIHYLMNEPKADKCSTSSSLQSWGVWEQFVLRLLASSPETAKMKDGHGRLPLHHLLGDHHHSSSAAAAADLPNAVNACRQRIVEKLLQIYPESIDVQDPKTKLDPFMLAATATTDQQSAPLDLIFLLLRHSPSRCTNSRTDKTMTVVLHNS